MRNYFKRLPRKVFFALIFIGVFMASIYLYRNTLLQQVAEKRLNKIEQQYHLDIHYKKLSLHGINNIDLTQLSVVPEQCDTLLTLNSLQIKFSLWDLIWGKFHISRTDINGLKVSFIKNGAVSNYDFLFTNKPKDVLKEVHSTPHYADRVNNALSLLYDLLPENGTLKKVTINERRGSHFVTFSIPLLQITDNRFETEIGVKEDSLSQRWLTEGSLSRSERKIQAKLYAPDKKIITLPYLQRKFGAEVSFNSMNYSLAQEKTSASTTTLHGKAQIESLQVFQASLSPEVIHLKQGELEYQFNIAPQSIELDSNSVARFNQMSFHPFLRAEKNDSTWHFTASVNKPWFPAQELFGSLPEGLFSNLQGLQTKGELAYHFLFDVDFAQIDSLTFESELQKKNFAIEHFGTTNLRKMADEFEYTAYEYDQPVRTFPIGPSWEHFTPLDSIPYLLQRTIMQSEDNAFFNHRGFLPEAMSEALAQDLKEKRFARGGSTISMQLIKNVFLNRHKNIARKLEEALIVWLIENEHLTSKERMFEVYLNIIEWGPMIYGVHEAAQFYFSKRPSQLTLEECIFLAHTIPSPKHFMWAFTDDGQLKEYVAGYYQLIVDRLLQHGVISEAQAAAVRPEVKLNGNACNYLRSHTTSTSEPATEMAPTSTTE